MLVAILCVAGNVARIRADATVDRLKATYAALSSYRDRGTVLVESQFAGLPLSQERFEFETAFERPSRLLFVFRPSTETTGDTYAAWSQGDIVESWWSATGVRERLDKERAAVALLTGAFPTKGASINVPSLLFPRAELHSTLWDFVGERETAVTLDGREATMVVGSSGGHFGSRRPVTLWIDKASGLVLKILEDTPDGSVAGTVDRITTTFAPVANSAVAPNAFVFTPPTPP